MSNEREELAGRIATYLEDAPMDGRHSDAAGGNAYELLAEAEDALRAGPAASPRPVDVPLAVRLRDEEGPPLPQMVAQRRAALAATPASDEVKFVYVKRWRTIVMLPAKYADEIVDALRSPPSGSAGAMREALATAYLIGRGMTRASISTIREYQGETWLRALDEADKIVAFAASQDGVK